MELNLAKNVKNKKGFYRYIGQKRQTKESVPLWLTKRESWPPQTWRRLRFLMSFFALVFLDSCIPHSSHVPELLSGCQGSKIPPSVREEWVQGHLMRLNMDEYIGPHDIYPRVLKKLADVAAVFYHIWKIMAVRWGPQWMEKGKHHFHSQERKKGRPGEVPGQIMEWILLGEILRHVWDEEVIWDSQHGFFKSRLCLTTMVAFYEKMMTWMDKGRTTAVTYLYFCKSFDSIAHHILNSKLRNMDLKRRLIGG